MTIELMMKYVWNWGPIIIGVYL